MGKKNPKKPPVDVPVSPGPAEFVEPGAKDPPPLAALADDLASLPAHVEPRPVKPSEEAEAVYRVMAEAYGPSSVGDRDRIEAAAVAVARRFPGLTKPVYGIDWPADKMKLAAAGTFENATEEPLAFNGGSTVLLEFNGDSWAAIVNAASGAGYVKQTKAESSEFKTPQHALAAVLRMVRERAKGVAS